MHTPHFCVEMALVKLFFHRATLTFPRLASAPRLPPDSATVLLGRGAFFSASESQNLGPD